MGLLDKPKGDNPEAEPEEPKVDPSVPKSLGLLELIRKDLNVDSRAGHSINACSVCGLKYTFTAELYHLHLIAHYLERPLAIREPAPAEKAPA
jgi:hypothetical protein